MIHRCQNIFAAPIEPNIVFLAFEATPNLYYDLWKAGNLATPVRFEQTVITSTNTINDYLADPELSPDGTQVIYSRVGYNQTPKKQAVRKVDWDDTTDVELYSETGGAQNSLTPTWKPDGSKILFRAKGSGTSQSVIKHMDPDGSNVATLYTSGTSTNLVYNPVYNHDGSKVAWVEGTTSVGLSIHVMDADGSNHSAIYTPGGTVLLNPYAAWANGSNVLAYTQRPDSGFTQNFLWRKINSDGTGNTTLLTINRSSGYGPGDIDPYPIKWTWLPDDTAIVTSREIPTDSQPKWVLTTVMADGSGYVDYSPERRLYAGTPDARPIALGTRIYFPDTNANLTVLSSIKLDGSDYRTDFDGPTVLSNNPLVTYHGFKGDTINV